MSLAPQPSDWSTSKSTHHPSSRIDQYHTAHAPRCPIAMSPPTLQVAAARPQQVAGTVLVNCAGGMNNKAIADDWRIKLAMPIFLLIDWLLLQPTIARWLFDSVRQPANIKSAFEVCLALLLQHHLHRGTPPTPRWRTHTTMQRQPAASTPATQCPCSGHLQQQPSQRGRRACVHGAWPLQRPWGA